MAAGSSVPYIHLVAGADCHALHDHIHRLAHDGFTHPYIPYIHWLIQLLATVRSSPWVHVSVSNPGRGVNVAGMGSWSEETYSVLLLSLVVTVT